MTSVPNEYQVLIRGPNYEIREDVRDYTSLDVVPRRNDIGTFELALPAASPVATRITDRSGIIIKRDGTTILSGWADRIARTGTTLTMTGRDDMALLLTPARPNPALAQPPFGVEYNVLTGVASTMLRTLVNANIGPAAPIDWRLAPIVFGADPLLGVAPVTLRAKMQPLLTILAAAADSPEAGGLNVRLMQSDTVPNSLEFVVTAPTVRPDAKFSTELGTADDFDDVRTQPQANHAFGGLGDNLGAARTLIYDEDVPSILAVGRRISQYVELRDVTDPAEGHQRLQAFLAGAARARQSTVTPAVVSHLVYGTHYDLGDLVSFAVDGDVLTGVIQEVKVVLDEHGATVTPLIGQPGSSNDDPTAQHVEAVLGRLSALETNFGVPDDSITLAMMTPASVGTAQLVDGGVSPPKLYAVSPPNNNEVPGYNASAGRFQWQTVNALLGTNPTFAGLTITGNTTLGDAPGDTLTVNATTTFNNPVTVAAVLTSTVATGTAPFTVASTTRVSNLNADLLDGHDGSDFALLAGAAFTGNVSVSGNGLFVDAGANKVRINSATVSGWDLTVGVNGILAEGGSRFQGQVLVSTGGVDVTGGSTFHSAVTVSAGGVDVTGSSTFHNGVTFASGLSASSSSVFNAAVSITVGGLTVLAGGVDVTGTGTFNNAISVASFSIFSAGFSVTAGGISITAGGLDVNSGLFHASGGQIGFFSATPTSRPTITGSRSSNAALASLLGALNNMGLVIDSST